MASSTAEQVLDLKRQAIALRESGDTNGAMVLLAQARDLEFEHASVEDLWEPLKLKQFAVVRKKRGDLEAAREALIKAKQIEKEGLMPPTQAGEDNATPQAPQAEPALAAPTAEEQAPPPAPEPEPEPEPVPTPDPPQPAAEITPPNDNNYWTCEACTFAENPNEILCCSICGAARPSSTGEAAEETAAVEELLAMEEEEEEEPVMDVAFSLEEMADQEMMTEFKSEGMPVPTDEEYQAKILEAKKAALAAKKAGDTALALQELQQAKKLEAVRVALSQVAGGDLMGGDGDDGWMENLNPEESELLGELLPSNNNKQPLLAAAGSDIGEATSSPPKASHRLEDVLEELADFLEDPDMFLDALEMGMEVPTLKEVEAAADEHKMKAIEHKKAGNLEGAKSELVRSKQFTAHAMKLRVALANVQRKKNGGAAPGNVNMEDLEAMLEADEKKEAPKAAAAPAAPAKPKEKSSAELREEAVRLRDQKKIKEAGEVLKLYKAALKREQDAAELKRRQELVNEIRKEIDFAQHQVRIFEYYQRFCDPESQQVAWWQEYIQRCSNVSKLILAKGTDAVKIVRKKTAMMSAKQVGGDDEEEEDFNALIADLLDQGASADSTDERLEIAVVSMDKIQENTNLQKLYKKQKRENLPQHPSTIKLEVHIQIPPNETDTDSSIDLVIDPPAMDPLERLELTTAAEDKGPMQSCEFNKSEFVELPRGDSAYGKIIRRRIERNKKIQLTAYYAPIPQKKGWFSKKKNKEELPPPTLLGKIQFEMQDLMTKRCCAAGEFPLMNGSGTKELGGSLKLAIRTGVPFGQPGEEDDAESLLARTTKLEPYTVMAFSLNKQEEATPSTAAEV